MGCKLKEGHCNAVIHGFAHCDKECPNYKEFVAITKDIENDHKEPEQAEWKMENGFG